MLRNHVGERIAQVRIAADVSQARLAKRVGVTVGTIQNYERGRNSLTVTRLWELAIALNCEPADLLKPSGSPLPRRFRRIAGCLPLLLGS